MPSDGELAKGHLRKTAFAEQFHKQDVGVVPLVRDRNARFVGPGVGRHEAGIAHLRGDRQRKREKHGGTGERKRPVRPCAAAAQSASM